MKPKHNKHINFSANHAYILCVLTIFAVVAGSASASPTAAAAPAKVRVYSIKPSEIFGISQVKQATSISDVQIIDLSIIPQMEAVFGVHAKDQMNQEAIAKIKALSARLARQQLQRLANAQMSLFDLQTRYDVAIDDLPVVIFEQDKTLYLYKGSNVYQGFLLWQQSKR